MSDNDFALRLSECQGETRFGNVLLTTAALVTCTPRQRCLDELTSHTADPGAPVPYPITSGRGRVASALSIGAALTLTLSTAACGGDAAAGGSGGSGKPVVGLITKTDTNPFFVKMKAGAQQAAAQ